MEGRGRAEGWGEEHEDAQYADDEETEGEEKETKSREGMWESGKGRCAVTGRRVLGGTDGLRRVMV